MIFKPKKKKMNSIILIIIVSKGFWRKEVTSMWGLENVPNYFSKSYSYYFRHANMTQPND